MSWVCALLWTWRPDCNSNDNAMLWGDAAEITLRFGTTGIMAQVGIWLKLPDFSNFFASQYFFWRADTQTWINRILCLEKSLAPIFSLFFEFFSQRDFPGKSQATWKVCDEWFLSLLPLAAKPYFWPFTGHPRAKIPGNNAFLARINPKYPSIFDPCLTGRYWCLRGRFRSWKDKAGSWSKLTQLFGSILGRDMKLV